MNINKANNLKHKELYKWYNEQPDPKPIRSKFMTRVIRYKRTKEESIKLKIKHKTHTTSTYD